VGLGLGSALPPLALICMKTLTLVLVSLLVSFRAFCGTDIDLGGKVVTFTNLQGRVFADVKLEHANLDGVIYSLTNGTGGGMVKFKDLDPSLLTSLNIPPERLQIAQQREKADAERKVQYDAAVRALALKQRQQAALAASNALAQADAATNQPAAGTQPAAKRTKTQRVRY